MSKIIVKSQKVYRNSLLNLVKGIINKEPLNNVQKDSLLSKIDLLNKKNLVSNWRSNMNRFSGNTIMNEMIMKIIGLFAKLDLETQIMTVKTLAQTIERQHNISEMEREPLEEQEHLLQQQHEMMQALSNLEEKSGLYK